jgi:hypothetical protein
LNAVLEDLAAHQGPRGQRGAVGDLSQPRPPQGSDPLPALAASQNNVALDSLSDRLSGLGYSEGSKQQIITAILAQEPVVIVGENMRRVEAVANMVRKAGGEAVTYNPRSWPGPTRNAIEANRSWLRYWVIEKEASVIDIGRQPTPRPQGPSAAYGMENRSLQKWNIFTPFNQ